MKDLPVLSREKTWPLAPHGVFRTIQGEGNLSGLPMIFVRLAGCSVGCATGCDTDYLVDSRATIDQLRSLVSQNLFGSVKWAWITGGEPTDHDLAPIVAMLRDLRLRVALATAGTKAVATFPSWEAVDFLSVSPHTLDDKWVVRRGDQVNLVPGLNGLTLESIRVADDDGEFEDFNCRYLTPMADKLGAPTNLEECIDFVSLREDWRLGMQAHLVWRLP